MVLEAFAIVDLVTRAGHMTSTKLQECWAHLQIRRLGHVEQIKHQHSITVRRGAEPHADEVKLFQLNLRSSFPRKLFVKHKTTNLADAASISNQGIVNLTANAYFAESWCLLTIMQSEDCIPERLMFGIPSGHPSDTISGIAKLEMLPRSIDALKYIASYTDLIDAFGANAALGRDHYRTYGLTEGRQISFNPLRYIASHPDLHQLGLDERAACSHFILRGSKEQRALTFDYLLYLAGYPNLIEAFGDNEVRATEHFITQGFSQGLHCDAFRWNDYFAQNPDLYGMIEPTREAAARHFVQKGYMEGRRV